MAVEISNENALDNWKRMGMFKPSLNRKIHTMRAIRGTDPQDFGTANIILYAYVRMKDLFEFKPKIEMYITPNGRIVTPQGLPWSAVVMIRRYNDENSTINKDTVGLQPPPAAPGGPKRVRSRESRGERYAMNMPQTPMPDRTIRNKSGQEFKSGFHNMLERMCGDGPPWEQHIKLQMLRGLYTTKMCNYDARGARCEKADKCCFSHSNDNQFDIAARVNPLRKEVFTELFNMKFSLPLGHLHEIGKITDQEFEDGQQKKLAHEDREFRSAPDPGFPGPR